MCAKAIVDARIRSLYFGANEPKTGAIESIDQFLDRDHLNHKVFLVEDICKSNPLICLENFFNLKEKRNFLKNFILIPAKLGNDLMVFPLL